MKTKTIVCLHGLGTSSATFDELKKSPALSGYKFITPDYAGHARALNETYRGDPLAFAAEKISVQIEELGENAFLVGHSMGGALALLIADKIPTRVSGVISIEGNLISEDCGLVSRRLALAPDTAAVEKLRKEVIEMALQFKNPGWDAWAKDIAQVPPAILKDYASSVVRLSDSGNLIRIFGSIKKPKAYIYGDDYIGHPVIKKLAAASVPTYHAKGTGHFIMRDAPDLCARLITETMDGKRRVG
jgi:pimeloyl-ACP methyl ester carboxylesterase